MQSLESKDCHKGGPFLLCKKIQRREDSVNSIEDIKIKQDHKEKLVKIRHNDYYYLIESYTDDYGYLLWKLSQDLSNKSIDNYVIWSYTPFIKIHETTDYLEEGLYKPLIDFKEMKITLQKY